MSEYESFDYQEDEFEGYGTLAQRKARRQREASERFELRAARGDKGQIARLNAGNYMAEKERARLNG